MECVETVDALRRQTRAWRRAGDRIALVPTAGSLHEGHAAVIRTARAECDRVIVTAFDGPPRVGDRSPNTRRPPPAAEDIEFIASHSADLAFVPDPEHLYPPGFATRIQSEHLAEVMCGATDPDGMRDVALMILKFLNMARPDVAYFGEKDWQQVQLIGHIVRDLDIPTRIQVVETVRHEDGLALATRNRHLSDRGRAAAPVLYRALRETAARIGDGTPTELACAEAQEQLYFAGFRKIDYLECRDAATLRLAPAPAVGARVFGAGWIDDVRLIDNVPVADRLSDQVR